MAHHLFPRRALPLASESLDDFRAIVLQGARQVGKSTLANLLAESTGARGATLDREEDLASAKEDPEAFLDVLGVPAVIDEIQRAGDPLVLAIKGRLDSSNARGQYVLTGSTNFLSTPSISESLAGRIDLVTLWPLAMGELAGGADGFVDRVFLGRDALLAHDGETPERSEYLRLMCVGGYPEVQRLGERGRARWFERYLETVLRREIETAADIRRFDGLFGLARHALLTTGTELVVDDLSRRLGLARPTVESYHAWVETAFLIHRVPAWGRKVTTKSIRRPKVYACDTGLAATIAGKDPVALGRRNDPFAGPLTETFVAGEIAKQLTWSDTRARLHHLRDRDGLEVDFILEAADGRIVAVEVKASTVARSDDAAPLARLRDRLDSLGTDFVCGVVAHAGDRRVPLGDRLCGLPLADLWT